MLHRSSAASSAESPLDPLESIAESDAVESPAPDGWKLSRWTALAALTIAVLALTLTLVQWFHSASHNSASPVYTDQQVKDAKKNICAANMIVSRAVITNTHLESSPVDGPLAVATSARLALYGGGGYLQERLAREPAAPADLTNAVTSMAITLEDLGINYLSGAPAFAQDRLRQNLDGQMSDVDRLCK